MLKVNDFFCGCGGMGLGFKKAGYKLAGAWDFDKYAVQSYAANVDSKVQQADVTEMKWTDVPAASVWTFGFPCQDLSLAGERAGLMQGKRSKMFFEIMRLLEETRTNAPEKLPSVILAENVKGLKPYLKLLEEEYAKQGYVMYYTLYNSKYWGVAQNRERYFVVGVRKDLDKGYFHFQEQSRENIPFLSSFLEDEVDEKYYYSAEKSKTIIEIALTKVGADNLQDVFTDKDGVAFACNARYWKGASYADVLKSRNTQIIEAQEPSIQVIGMLDFSSHDHSRRVHDPDGLSPTVTAVAGGTHHIKIFDYSKFRVRKLTPREYGRLQAFGDDYRIVVSNTQAYRQFGNAVTVTVANAVAEAIKNFLEG